MVAEETASAIKTLHVVKEVLIAAPADIVFQTVLEPHGPMKEMNMKLEPWPGGRWFRDLGNNTGHLWGHVQVIKPPKVLELIGPTMMSYPVASHIQYRLTEQAGGTLRRTTSGVGQTSRLSAGRVSLLQSPVPLRPLICLRACLC